jgi:hypothetical protein
MSRSAWLISAFLLLAFVTTVPRLHAADSEDFDSYKLRMDAFWFYSQPSGRIQGKGGNGFFDLQKDIHFNSYSTFTVKLDWKFTRKNHLYFIATNFDQTKQVVLGRTVVFQGQTFNAGAAASGQLQSLVLIPGYQYDIIRRRRGSLGLQAQLDIFDITGTVSAAAQVNGGVPQAATRSSGSLRAPLPVAGPTVRYYLLPDSSRLFVTANVLGMYFFGYGNFVSSTGTVGLTLTRHIALRGGYQLGSRLNVNTKSDRIGLDLTQKGAVAGFEFSF